MVATELVILGVLDVLCLLSIALLALWIRKELEESVSELDSTLAPLKTVLDKLLGGVGEDGVVEYEAPDPIKMAVAQVIQAIAANKLSTINAVVQQKAPDGKFQSTIDEFQ